MQVFVETAERGSLTQAGQALEMPRAMVSRYLESLEQWLGALHSAPSGRLRITASASFAQACLADVMAEFLALYPKVEIELLAQERAVNLVEDRIDLAVRIGNQLDESLVARRLGVCHSALCASPAYLAAFGMPASAQALNAHRCITHAYVGRNELRLRQGEQLIRVPWRGVLQTNEPTRWRTNSCACFLITSPRPWAFMPCICRDSISPRCFG